MGEIMRSRGYSIALIACGVIAIFAISKLNKGPALLFTEVCSNNDTVIYSDSGKYVDYVEVYNNTNIPLDLANYYMSDKDISADFYSFSKDILEPGEYKVVFLGRKFSLSNGEAVYLFDNTGKIIDSVEVEGLEADKVCARNLSTGEWINNCEPSPGSVNSFESIKVIPVLEGIVPQLGVEPGFYDEPFYLELSVNGDYDIYYTLDGTQPDKNAILYERPILIEDITENPNVYSAITDISVIEDSVVVPEWTIDKCNIIRAVAVSEDGAVSREICGSYFVNYSDKDAYEDMYTISLITDPENLFDYYKGIYVNGYLADKNWFSIEEENRGNIYAAIANYSRSGKGWQRPAVVELYDKDGKQLYRQEIKIGIHGGWSVAFSQKGFNLLTDNDASTLEKEFLFSGLLGDAHTSLMLRPGGFRDWKYTKFRDVLNQRLVEDRDITILRAVPCQVFVDGEYWGLYNLQERIDRSLIAQNFGVREEDIIVLKNNNVVGNDDAYYQLYTDVVAYAQENDLSLERHYTEMEKMIDIQSYIDYYCFQIYVANCDSIANNYSCWRTLPVSDEEYYDGRWRWILYDTDDSAGMVEELSTAEADSFYEGHWSVTPMEDPLFSSLIKNEEFKERFVNTFIEMADINFSYERVEEVLNELSSEYKDAVVLSRQRFEGLEITEEQYLQDVEVVRDFFERRREHIIKHMENALNVDVG